MSQVFESDAPVITIDGPSGSGKGTISQLLAKSLGWHFLDSGALYRIVALAARQQGLGVDDDAVLAGVATAMDVSFAPADNLEAVVILNGNDVSGDIREESIGVLASRVAAGIEVRSALLRRQRQFAILPGLVADGRDMGTVVFPAAALKIFLIASAGERAQRRYKQLKNKGENDSLENISLEKVLEDIKARDERDSSRAVSPLVPAADALLIDSTAMTIADVQQRILAEARTRGL